MYCKECRMENMAASCTPEHHQMQSQSGSLTSESASSINSSSQTPVIGMPLSLPRTPPDQGSIQSSMDRNKETLKRKLMMRRSVNELVDRGIYPPLKTPPAFAEKTKQLERAKTGDLLRHKIQHRPDRQLLVQQHILEDTTIDPSLHERQRLLKRSRLLDGLNDKLAHRPGPLELVQGNILQSSHELANAIKDGTIQFLPTCDTEDMDQSSSSFMFDDESTGSDSTPSPSMDESSGLSDVSSPSSAPPIPFSESFPISFTLTKSITIPISANKSPQFSFVSPNTAIFSASSSTSKLSCRHPGTSVGTSTFSSHSNSNIINGCTGKSRSKKPKPKTLSKARIIKFHEYKGPPSVVKSQSSNIPAAAAASANLNAVEEKPYHILLQQQQLFLQWQLEFQHRQQHGPAAVLDNSSVSPTLNSVIVTSPVVTTTSTAQAQPAGVGNTNLVRTVTPPQPLTLSSSVVTQSAFSPVSLSGLNTPQTSPPDIPPSPPPPPTRATLSVAPRQSTKALTSIPASALSLPKLTGNLEEMKVADLKAELKKRSLPVSGPKPQLIERLKPFTESNCCSPLLSTTAASKSNNSRAPSNILTPLQFSQTTFQIKTEPNGDLTTSPVTRPIPSTTTTSLLTSSSPCGVSNRPSTFSLPISFPFSMQGLKTVVSVKPMVKEEPMTTTDVSPTRSPPILQTSTSVPTTPMSPEYEAISPNLTPRLTLPASLISQSLVKPVKLIRGQLPQNGNRTINSVTDGQTIVSINTDTQQPASMMPAEMMAMEVDSVSIDLNQGVDDTAFKAASMGHSLDAANFRAFIQHSITTPSYKTSNLCQNQIDNKTSNSDTGIMDTNTVQSISLSPNFETSSTIKTININHCTESSTIKTINLGSNTDCSPLKNQSFSPSTESPGLKTVSLNPVRETNSVLNTINMPLSQLSPIMSPVQATAQLTHTLSSPASLLHFQQLQTLQQLQQQLLQQTQLNQFQQHSDQATAAHQTTNDQVVLAQAKQIEELQRQLQESHLKLKLQQLQQQHMQLQQHPQHHQQQQQQKLWQVQIPPNFAQNSILTKLSQEQLTNSSQTGQVMTAPLQQQPTQIMLQSTAPVVQHQQPSSVVLSAHINQSQTSGTTSGAQQTNVQHQQASVMMSNQNGVSGASNMTSEGNLITMTGVTNGQTAVSLPYAIHFNLTSSGQVKLPPQLQPITTSTSAATTTKSSALPHLQLSSELLLTPTSTSFHATQHISSESCASNIMGTPPTTSVPKSQMTSGHSYVLTAAPSSDILIPGHTNGIISRTSSLPLNSMGTDQQKLHFQRCSSNGYFNGHLKEPPRYDEAIKIKQQQTIPPAKTNNNNKSLASSKSCMSRTLNLSNIDPSMKSQTMDDVLEILIRNGELPPSAANEALPPSKLTPAADIPQASAAETSVASTACVSLTPSMSTVLVTAQNQPTLSTYTVPSAQNQPMLSTTYTVPSAQNQPMLSTTYTVPSAQNQPMLSTTYTVPSAQNQPLLSTYTVPSMTTSVRNMNNNFNHNRHHLQNITSSANPRDQTLTSVHTSRFSDRLLNDTSNLSTHNHDTSGRSSYLNLNDSTCHSDEGELLDWGEMLSSPDLCSMDWSNESGFGHLDLGDSNLNLDSKMTDSGCQSSNETRSQGILDQDQVCTNNVFGSECQNNNNGSNNNSIDFHTSNICTSETDLTSLSLGGHSSEPVDPVSQMDMTEWLDVIMPNSNINLEYMNAPTHISFSADPILTSQTHEEVFDIFNFDDPDFGPPIMSWDKMAEQGTNS